ncbi:uncharacterized protein LOC119981720 isoform X3 [Tripterygium wilfordii]|uniref:uncharacterized protein LOC119981720 isoform X3 n=1 Tax=Tripterygium wilfordii TaxID=458696 RepID=UPI0018F82D52|nr:uncharacterized protein LOC119981720 isoform X3 [Tripterygium wilfordii]
MPTMSDIIGSSRAQNLDLQLQLLGPLFRNTAKSRETKRELGRAEGLIRVWLGGRILHLDSIRLRRETLGLLSCLPSMTLIFTIRRDWGIQTQR